MSKKAKIAGLTVLILGVLFLIFQYFQDKTIAVFAPRGTVASQQRDIIIATLLLSLIVVIPVFVLTFWISWRYREGHKKPAKYSPDWDGNRWIEAVWWGVPMVLIAIISVITWRTSHSLDPFKPLESSVKPLTVQVVALDWKWLFIYPEQDVATVNYLFIPTDRPINFEVTSDAPMNSFWIPQLGGQIYAMAGMSTKIHLMADQPGDYRGSSGNISGKGFAKMHFNTYAVPQSEFDTWVALAGSSPESLSQPAYDELAKPSEERTLATYAGVERDLYDTIVMKYMMPGYGGMGEITGMTQPKAGH